MGTDLTAGGGLREGCRTHGGADHRYDEEG
jgi:hypothetical protein